FSGNAHAHVVHYNPDGTIINDFNLDSWFGGDTGPRVCPCEDDLTAIWIWERWGGATNSGNTSRFTKVSLADGSIIVQFEQVMFEYGIYRETETLTPVDIWGHSESCFFAAFPPAGGRLIINKTVVPSSDTTSFEFTSDLGEFSLAHSEIQTF